VFQPEIEPPAGKNVFTGSGVAAGADGWQAVRINTSPIAAATHLPALQSLIMWHKEDE
jgi:hypothetical protein